MFTHGVHKNSIRNVRAFQDPSPPLLCTYFQDIWRVPYLALSKLEFLACCPSGEETKSSLNQSFRLGCQSEIKSLTGFNFSNRSLILVKFKLKDKKHLFGVKISPIRRYKILISLPASSVCMSKFNLVTHIIVCSRK